MLGGLGRGRSVRLSKVSPPLIHPRPALQPVSSGQVTTRLKTTVMAALSLKHLTVQCISRRSLDDQKTCPAVYAAGPLGTDRRSPPAGDGSARRQGRSRPRGSAGTAGGAPSPSNTPSRSKWRRPGSWSGGPPPDRTRPEALEPPARSSTNGYRRPGRFPPSRASS